LVLVVHQAPRDQLVHQDQLELQELRDPLDQLELPEQMEIKEMKDHLVQRVP
jgi:hypothetical protein